MQKLISIIFRILGTLMLSLLLWMFIMGPIGRTSMWNVIEPTMQNHWSEVTLQDGYLRSVAIGNIFDGAVTYTK